MLKRLVVILGLIMPFAAQAGCSRFDPDTQTLHVRTRVMKEETVHCDATGLARRDTVAASSAKQTRAYRRTNNEKLRAFDDLKRQSDYLNSSPQYYGQR